ncbi:hypothetical protein AVEN_236240-1 [Araneus ventricosus]|uniref:Uncharacterized protein n=1 Tax=Araneus ventricosus TaxID=182803 RepID=A0A4Y2CDM3_ARAVE|nr:hypothetical protein AVEN_236240-1 [Araneus ventricosus]
MDRIVCVRDYQSPCRPRLLCNSQESEKWCACSRGRKPNPGFRRGGTLACDSMSRTQEAIGTRTRIQLSRVRKLAAADSLTFFTAFHAFPLCRSEWPL